MKDLRRNQMKIGEKGIATVAIVGIVVVVVAAAAVGGYFVLTGGGGAGGLSSGTDQLITGGDLPATFKFSTRTSGSADYDFAIEPWQNWYGHSGVTPAVQGYDGIDNLVQDMGAVGLASVTTAPETGYSPDNYAQAGHVYVIKCRDGNYAKIRITNITFTAGEYPATVQFDWVYQPNGSRTF